MSSIALGCVVGGSHITTCLVDLDRREIIKGSLFRRRVDSHGTPEDIIDSWAGCIKESIALSHNVNRIGIAMPGPFDYDAGISLIRGLNKYESLYGLNVKDLLSVSLGLNASDILMKNDAGCFLQGEVFSGAARDCKKAFGIALGTGFGSGVSEDEIAEDGEFWRIPFQNDIAENHFSTRWFIKRYQELSGKYVAEVKDLVDKVSSDSLVQLIFDEFSENLGAFLLERMMEHHPDVIVYGRNVTNAANLFLPPLAQFFSLRNVGVQL